MCIYVYIIIYACVCVSVYHHCIPLYKPKWFIATPVFFASARVTRCKPPFGCSTSSLAHMSPRFATLGSVRLGGRLGIHQTWMLLVGCVIYLNLCMHGCTCVCD